MSARTLIRNEKGNSTVEFSMILPVFVAFVFAGYFAGLTAFNMHTVHYSLTKAARALQLNPNLTETQFQKLVTDDVSKLSGGKNVTITLTKAPTSSGAKLDTAIAKYPLTFSVPMLGTYTYEYTTTVTVVVAAN